MVTSLALITRTAGGGSTFLLKIHGATIRKTRNYYYGQNRNLFYCPNVITIIASGRLQTGGTHRLKVEKHEFNQGSLRLMQEFDLL